MRTRSGSWARRAQQISLDPPVEFVRGDRIGGGIIVKCPCWNEVGIYEGECEAPCGEDWCEGCPYFLEGREATAGVRKAQQISVEDVRSFVEGTGTWLEYDGDDGRVVEFATRMHGDVGAEAAGREDVREAKRVERLVKEMFGDAVDTQVDVIDEWVDFAVMVKGAEAAGDGLPF